MVTTIDCTQSSAISDHITPGCLTLSVPGFIAGSLSGSIWSLCPITKVDAAPPGTVHNDAVPIPLNAVFLQASDMRHRVLPLCP